MNSDNADEYHSNSYQKMKDLIAKIVEMQKHSQHKQATLDSTFENLRADINKNSVFLRTTKNQIENIKFLYQKEMLGGGKGVSDGKNPLENSDQTLEQMNSQVEDIKKQLDKIRQCTHVKTQSNESDETFQSTLTNVVSILDNAGKGVFESTTNEDN